MPGHLPEELTLPVNQSLLKGKLASSFSHLEPQLLDRFERTTDVKHNLFRQRTHPPHPHTPQTLDSQAEVRQLTEVMMDNECLCSAPHLQPTSFWSVHKRETSLDTTAA